MKILHVVHAYPPSIGGSQLLVQNLSERLVADYGDQVTVFTTVAQDVAYLARGVGKPLPAGVETINGVTVRRFPVMTGGSFLREAAAALAYRLRLPGNEYLRTLHNGPIIPALSGAVAASGADVIFATAFPLMHMFDALRGARKANIPIVLLGALHLADRWHYDRRMIYRAITQADAYIAHTEAERAAVVAHGVDPQWIHVIGGGVDAARFAAASGVDYRVEQGWGDEPVVLLLGKHVPRKRHDLLLRAMQRVWQARPDARLLFIGGETQYSEQIREMINGLPPEQRAQVSVETNVRDARKIAAIAACDLLVLPSSEDSFGIVFVEAWACGKPVIGADVPAIASLIKHGQDGLLFVAGDAESLAQRIGELIADRELCERLGAAGRAKVDGRYTWAAVTRDVRSVYEGVIKARARR